MCKFANDFHPRYVSPGENVNVRDEICLCLPEGFGRLILIYFPSTYYLFFQPFLEIHISTQ